MRENMQGIFAIIFWRVARNITVLIKMQKNAGTKFLVEN